MRNLVLLASVTALLLLQGAAQAQEAIYPFPPDANLEVGKTYFFSDPNGLICRNHQQINELLGGIRHDQASQTVAELTAPDQKLQRCSQGTFIARTINKDRSQVVFHGGHVYLFTTWAVGQEFPDQSMNIGYILVVQTFPDGYKI